MSHCHQESCSKNGCGCQCGCANCSCHHHEHGSSCHSGTCGSHHSHEGDFSHQLLELADEAWMEVLKEKIKEEVHKLSGDNLTELAQLVAHANHKRWGAKMQAKECCESFECQIHAILSNSKSCCEKK